MTDYSSGKHQLPPDTSQIRLRGVRVHNLKNVNLDIPLNQIVTLCGISGSGKTSLAFDTIFAEGQRRYLETLSPAARQYINQLPRPDADQITQIPPTIALKQNAGQRSARGKGNESNVGIESGIQNYLRLLYSNLGQVICPECQIPVTPQSPESVLAFIKTLPEQTRFQISFPLVSTQEQPARHQREELIQQGLTRVVIDHQSCKLDNQTFDTEECNTCLVVLDRLSTQKIDDQRILESLELAFAESAGTAVLLSEHQPENLNSGKPYSIDQKNWHRFDFFSELICPQCEQHFLPPEPQLFNPFSQTGVCPVCQGAGMIPQATQTVCRACQGSRLNPAALAIQVNGINIDQLSQHAIYEVDSWIQNLESNLSTGPIIREISDRLTTLIELGLGYLALNRPRSTLSSGELQRVMLASVLSSNLVNTLYILDEPSSGLHPADNVRVLSILQKLKDLKNSLIIVEHEPDFLRAADQIIELGPGAGQAGGEVIFQGNLDDLVSSPESPTGKSLQPAGTNIFKSPATQPASGSITLTGVTRNNLQGITVCFPLGQMCAVTGVSGSGKSSLVEQTLYPLLSNLLNDNSPSITDSFCESITGAEQIDDVVLLDQSLVGQTPRSIPATYLNLFDEIRAIFADLPEARLRNLSPKDFSFNSKQGGRCPECKGIGFIEIDLQFLADLTMTCPSCHGHRYQRELLEIKYRKRHIAEVLEMTVDEAFPFFRGQAALQKKLKQLKDVGLGYIPLGQPLPSLSGGECQRLKLAAYLTTSSRNKTLFLMNEPSRGLHPQDILYLVNCFDYLLTAGHSLILIEHNLQLIQVANQIIDLGPGGGTAGGQVVVTGTPDEIAQHPTSLTGAALRTWMSSEENKG